MAQQYTDDDRDSESEIKFYLPAGVMPSFVSSRIQRLRASLSSQDGGPSN